MRWGQDERTDRSQYVEVVKDYCWRGIIASNTFRRSRAEVGRHDFRANWANVPLWRYRTLQGTSRGRRC